MTYQDKLNIKIYGSELGKMRGFWDIVETLKIKNVMQFIGLKDKNGKEIYEGDVLSMHNGQYKSQVYWDEGRASWYMDHLGNGGGEPVTTFLEDHKVIGNIYENPDLLK